MTVRLTWQDNNADETGHRVYRSTTPMDATALPTPIAELAANVLTYDDTTAPVGTDCYYRVAAVRNGELAVSAESMIRTPAAGDGTETPVEGDLYWDKVSTLLHFDSMSGVNQFTDSKGQVWTATNVTVDSDQKQIGAGSALFSTGEIKLSTVPESFSVGTGDFTVEAWVKPAAGSSGYRDIWCAQGDNGLALNSSDQFTWYATGGAKETSGTITLGQWYHVVAVRQSGVIKLYVNGVATGSGSALANNYIAGEAVIGRKQGANNEYWMGNIDEFRLTKGVARYTADFTPPTGPFPNSGSTTPVEGDLHWDKVTFLLDGDNFTPATGQVLTVGVSASTDTVNKPWGSGALKFTGASDSYISLTADFGILVGDSITVEMYVMIPSSVPVSSKNFILSIGDNTTGGKSDIVIYRDSGASYANRIYANIYAGSTSSIFDQSFTADTWHHVALSISANSAAITIDGQSYDAYARYTVSNLDLGGQLTLTVGKSETPNNAGYGTFYAKGIRITRANRYPTTPFQPPEGPFPTTT